MREGKGEERHGPVVLIKHGLHARLLFARWPPLQFARPKVLPQRLLLLLPCRLLPHLAATR